MKKRTGLTMTFRNEFEFLQGCFVANMYGYDAECEQGFMLFFPEDKDCYAALEFALREIFAEREVSFLSIEGE